MKQLVQALWHLRLTNQAKSPSDLLNIQGIEMGLLTAAGLSDKSLAHLVPEDKIDAINGLIRNFLEPVDANFVEELVCRFLLTRGDTLGGSMRNVGGALAQRNQTRLRKQTWGNLVQEFNKNILGDASQSEPKPDFSGAGISLSFKVTYNNPDFLKVQKRTLASIVAERNKLIHQDLAFIDTISVENYHNLITLLDEQNPRLLAQLEELRWMIESLRESLKAFEDLSKSPDFLQSLQSNQ